MSTLLDGSLEMNMTYLLPVLCILYVLLQRKSRASPISNSFKIMDTQPSVNFIDTSNDFSNVKVKAIRHGNGVSRIGDHLEDSHDHILSSQRQNEKDKALKANKQETMVPKYMIDLYKRLSRNTLGLSNSNIVRSFRNIDVQETDHYHDKKIKRKNDNDVQSQANVLTFNISSILSREMVNHAELRVFTSIEQDRNSYYFATDREVSLYEIIAQGDDVKKKYKFISSRRLFGDISDWEIFNVTSAVRRWAKSGSSIHKIEIRLENVWWGFSVSSVEFKTFPNNTFEPLLLVYSDDNSKHKEHTDERHELISHEYSSNSYSRDIEERERRSYKPSDIYLENDPEKNLSRRKRAKKFRRTRACGRRPMFVNFEDINWHTWIIAPRGYQAYQCVGKCFFPVNEVLSPSKHAIIQSTLHSHNPRKAVRACCVPTKLDPISILYIDEQGVITYKYQYDGMVVAECGCR